MCYVYYRFHTSGTGNVPLRCTVSIEDRLQLLFDLWQTAPCQCVVYYSHVIHLVMHIMNARAALVPTLNLTLPSPSSALESITYEHLKRSQEVYAQSGGQTTTTSSSSSTTNNNTNTTNNKSSSSGDNDSTSTGAQSTEAPCHIFDPRIAAYLCRSDSTEELLELSSLCRLFGSPVLPFEGSALCPLDARSLGRVRIIHVVHYVMMLVYNLYTYGMNDICNRHIYLTLYYYTAYFMLLTIVCI